MKIPSYALPAFKQIDQNYIKTSMLSLSFNSAYQLQTHMNRQIYDLSELKQSTFILGIVGRKPKKGCNEKNNLFCSMCTVYGCRDFGCRPICREESHRSRAGNYYDRKNQQFKSINRQMGTDFQYL